MTRRRAGAVVATAAALTLAAGLLAYLAWSLATDDGPVTHSFTVSRADGARLDRGEDLAVFPERLEADVGDEILIRNDDDRVHTVGPFVVGPGETLRQHLDRPGTYEGRCTLHPSGRVTIVVRG